MRSFQKLADPAGEATQDAPATATASLDIRSFFRNAAST